jgi:hypothetical protein
MAAFANRRKLRASVVAVGVIVAVGSAIKLQRHWTPTVLVWAMVWFAVGALVGSMCEWFVRSLATPHGQSTLAAGLNEAGVEK